MEGAKALNALMDDNNISLSKLLKCSNHAAISLSFLGLRFKKHYFASLREIDNNS